MPDGVIFTKSQALQLFYQTGDVPAPVYSGDAINLGYFQNNVNVTGDIQVSSAIVGYSGDPVGYIGFWGGSGDDLYYMALGPSGNLYFGSNEVTTDATVNPLLAASLGAILEDGSTYFDNSAYAEHANTYAIKSRKNLIADVTDLNDDFSDGDLNSTFWDYHVNADPLYNIVEAGTTLQMTAWTDQAANDPVYSGNIVCSKWKLSGDFEIIVEFGGITDISWSFGDGIRWAVGMIPFVADINNSAQDAELEIFVESSQAQQWTNGWGMAAYHYRNYGGSQGGYCSSIANAEYGAGFTSQPDGNLTADGYRLKWVRSASNVSLYQSVAGSGVWTALFENVAGISSDVMLAFANSANDAKGIWNINEVTLVSGSASYDTAAGPYLTVEGYGARLAEGEDIACFKDGDAGEDGEVVARIKARGDMEISGDLTVRGELTVMSGETIFAGVSGEQPGKMELLPGAANYPGRLVMHPASGAKQFMNVDDSGLIRFGTTDPAGNPDVNDLLGTVLGSLLIDGSNYMTDAIGFAGISAQIESRKNVVDSPSSVGDDFEDGALNTDLWTLDPSSNDKYSLSEGSGYLSVTSDNTDVDAEDDPRLMGVKANWTLDGDFDIRVQQATNSGSNQHSVFLILAPVGTTLAQISAEMYSEVYATAAGLGLAVLGMNRNSGTSYYYRSSSNGVTRDIDSVGNSSNHSKPQRFLRSGSTVTSYDANTWADRESEWDNNDSYHVINSPFNSDAVEVWLVWSDEGTSGATFGLTYNFEVTAGTIALGSGTGPLLQVGGPGAALPGSGEENIIEFYPGPISGEPAALIRDDGTFSGEDMYLGSIGALASTLQPPETHPWEPNGFLYPGAAGPYTTMEYSGDQFTISPVGANFEFWVSGEQFTSTGDTISLDTGEGNHWIYYNVTGELVVIDEANLTAQEHIQKMCLVSVYYWSQDSGETIFQGDERHGAQMDGATHRYLHECFGARYEEGLALNGYTINTSTDDAVRIGYTEGEIHDEDIDHEIEAQAHPAQIPIFYRYGATAWRAKHDTFPFIQPGVQDYPAGTYPAYNDENGGDWTLTDVGNQNYFNIWIIATTGIDDHSVIGVPNQTAHATLASAQEENFGDLNLTGLPTAETKVIWKLTYMTNASYGNSYKVRLTEVSDFRAAQLEGSGYTPVAHSSLSGRSDAGQHPEGAIELTGDFDGNLAGQTTLYGALQVVDDLSTGATTQITGESNIIFTGDYDGVISGESNLAGALATLDNHTHLVSEFGGGLTGEANITLTGDYSGGPVSGETNLFGALTSLNQRATRQVGWYMDGNDLTGDLLAIQPLYYGEGPYQLVSALADCRVAASGEALFDIQYCASGDFAASGDGWTTVFTTPLYIDSGEYSSQTAGTAAVVKSITLAEGTRLRAVSQRSETCEDITLSLVIRGTT